MKKILLTTIIMSIGISLVGCSNSTTLNNVNNKITIEEAKEIALKHANLTSDVVSFIRTETDIENGTEKYDIEFYHDNKEYDYEINATSGEILEYDYDVENYNIPNNNESSNIGISEQSHNESTSQSSSNTLNGQQSNNSVGNQQSNSGETSITLEEAKQIALNHAGLSSSQVSFIKSEMDFDDRIKKYDIEFCYQNKEYDYEINATNGQILGYDYDVENYTIQDNQTVNTTIAISTEKVKEIVLNHANLTSSQVSFVKTELDFDDGMQKYEIEFYFNNKEYNYEIDANTGNILKYEVD